MLKIVFMGEMAISVKCGLATKTVEYPSPWPNRAHELSKSSGPAPLDQHPRLSTSSAWVDQKLIMVLEQLPFWLEWTSHKDCRKDITGGQRVRISLNLWNSHTGPCSLIRLCMWGRLPCEICFSSYTLPGIRLLRSKPTALTYAAYEAMNTFQKGPRTTNHQISLVVLAKPLSNHCGLRNAYSFLSSTVT